MMTTNPPKSERRSAERLATPMFGLFLGGLMLVLLGLRGEWWAGAGFFAIMLTYSGMLLLLGRRSETVGLLGGDVPDERGRAISAKAAVFSGHVLVVIIVAMFLWELAKGQDGSPWAQLGGIGGLAFIGSTAWYSRRS